MILDPFENPATKLIELACACSGVASSERETFEGSFCECP
jgi:hypothetical protein